jgi:hypothetical protein
MDEVGFRQFLKRGGRSKSAVQRCLRFVKEFEEYLRERGTGNGLDEAKPDDLDAYVESIESAPKTSAKTHLWALRYYYGFRSNEAMQERAGELRKRRIKRKPFALGGFRGVNPYYVKRLAEVGIEDVEQMVKAGATPDQRQALGGETGIPASAIEEFVKLSDLARLPGVKRIRARLYHDAGVDSIEKMATWDWDELRAMLVDFVERTGFDGIAPLPKEAQNAVATAKKLPKIVEF